MLAVAFVAAWTPSAAQAAIGPQQVEQLDRHGATQIIVRREPGLTAAERADIRDDADVALTRRSSIADTEVVRADAGQPGRGDRRPATISATPPRCSAKMKLRKTATLKLPASTAGKIRVVVVRSRP